MGSGDESIQVHMVLVWWDPLLGSTSMGSTHWDPLVMGSTFWDPLFEFLVIIFGIHFLGSTLDL